MATWDATFENKPAGADAPSTLDNEQRNHRKAVEERMANEHDTYIADSTVGNKAKDWVHKEGSAVAYYESAEPTNQPNGETLAARDAGRLWVDSDTDEIKSWDGSSFNSQSFVDLTVSNDLTVTNDANITGDITYNSKQVTSDNILQGTMTGNVVFDKLDAFIPTNGDMMIVSGGYAFSSASYIIVGYAKREDATHIRMYGITGAGAANYLPADDGSATNYSVGIAW